MTKLNICTTCGRIHANALCAANSNFKPVSESAPRRRLSVAESIARNKARYKETLARLA